jgi:hypothetical protein
MHDQHTLNAATTVGSLWRGVVAALRLGQAAWHRRRMPSCIPAVTLDITERCCSCCRLLLMLFTNYVDRELLLPLVMQLFLFLSCYSYAHDVVSNQKIALKQRTSTALSSSSALPLK